MADDADFEPTSTFPPTCLPHLMCLSFALLQDEEWGRSAIAGGLNKIRMLERQSRVDLEKWAMDRHHLTEYIEIVSAMERDQRQRILAEAGPFCDSLGRSAHQAFLAICGHENSLRCGLLLCDFQVTSLIFSESTMRDSTQREYSLSLTPILDYHERLLRETTMSIRDARFQGILLDSVEAREGLLRRSLLRSHTLAMADLREFHTRAVAVDDFFAEYLRLMSTRHPSNQLEGAYAQTLELKVAHKCHMLVRSFNMEHYILCH